MSDILNRYERVMKLFDKILGILAFIAGTLIVLMMIAISLGVVFRFTPLGSIVWIIEITDYSLLWITFLGTAWVLKKEGHVRMDMLLNRLNPKTRNLVNIITSAVGAIACLVLAISSAKLTLNHFGTHHMFIRSIDVLSYPILVIIPIGSLLLFIQFLRRTRGYISGSRCSRD